MDEEIKNFQDPEEDVFYFETDHLALRGNKDYSEVLKTLFILCSQRKQAIKNYNKAVKLKNEAIENPGKVLEKIMKGESLEMPDIHSIAELPTIDWTQYNVKIPEDTLKQIYYDSQKKTVTPKKEVKISHGRWTAEEQKRLEELLQIYPPEPVEMQRLKKIANALGNRTLPQVASRVQKYFLKLYKAGLPIPGRIPKCAEKYKRSALHKHQRHNHYLWKPTTFFPDLIVPVVMDDLESAPGPSVANCETQLPTATNYLLPSTASQDFEQNENHVPEENQVNLQLNLMKRVRKEKLKEDQYSEPFKHFGYKCDYCNEEPIMGSRWHCGTCTDNSVDFCTDCVLSQMYTENCHPLTHRLFCYRNAELNLSDSDSNMGSDQESSHINSDSSDSDLNEEDNEHSQVQSEMLNGVCNIDTTSGSNNKDLELDAFCDDDNVSYNYLHSNLYFDKD